MTTRPHTSSAAETGRVSERFILVVLTAIQFTNILDFIILMPLGPQLMRIFAISPREFGFVVSAYTFSAGISGFLAAFFLDRFDRKSALLVLYAGFTIGTFLCSVAPSYLFLLGARVIAGTFGGILGATILTIVSDLVPYERRGAAMGLVMSSFSLAQIAGVPAGLFLANHFGWHMPFVFLAASALLCMIVSSRILPPMRRHLESGHHERPLETVKGLLMERSTLRALTFMAALIFAGFAIIPYISPYFVANAGRTEADLPYIYFFGGAATIISSRLIGRLADRFGKLRVFTVMASLSIIPIVAVTNMPPVSLPVAIVVLTLFMVLLSGRMVPSMAMVTATVEPRRRGSFLSINSSVQQLSAGVSSFGAGLILGNTASGNIENFGIVGLISAVTSIACVLLAQRLKPVDAIQPTVSGEAVVGAEG